MLRKLPYITHSHLEIRNPSVTTVFVDSSSGFNTIYTGHQVQRLGPKHIIMELHLHDCVATRNSTVQFVDGLMIIGLSLDKDEEDRTLAMWCQKNNLLNMDKNK